MRVAAIVLSALLLGASTTQPSFFPARYRGGELPALPVMSPGGGEVFLEVTVDPDGRVADIVPLRTTPPFTGLVAEAVRGWQFLPALDSEKGAVASTVLVAGMFPPPALYAPALGETPVDVAGPLRGTPLPVRFPTPAFPPGAFQGGIVLMEAEVFGDGRPEAVKVLRAAPPFDALARSALQDWRFRAGRIGETPIRGYAYVIFGFRVPVTPTIPRHP